MEVKQLIDDIAKITDQMIAFAEQGEWEAMLGVQDQRQSLYQRLEKVYSHSPHLLTQSMLTDLKARNEALLNFSVEMKEEAKAALTKLRGQQKAANAYDMK